MQQDDLFTPTLTEADDATGFDRPWRPWSMVVLAFFTGTLGAGALLAFNFERLGQRRHFWPALAATVAAWLLITGLTLWIQIQAPLGAASEPVSWYLARGLAAGFAALLAWRQRLRARLYQATGAEYGALLLPALLAGISSFCVELLVRGAVALWYASPGPVTTL